MSGIVRSLGLTLGIASSFSFCKRSPPPVFLPSDGGSTVVAADAGTATVPVVPVADAGPARELRSSAVTGDGTSFAMDGASARAPDGEHFTRYVALDPDGDGDRDAIVTRTRADGTAGVVFLRREPGAFTVVPIQGGDTPTDGACREVDLSSNSPRSAVATFRCTPATPVPGGAPAPAAASATLAEHLVIVLAGTPAMRMRVSQLGPQPAGTVIDTDVDAIDRDGDGRDDIVVKTSARRPTDRPEQSASASVVLFDRETGFARDTSEPEASFARLAASARSLATNRRRAGDALVAVDRIIRLRRAVCREPGLARVRIGADTGIACAGSAGLRAASEALARAYVTLGEYPAAVALTRADSAGELGPVASERLLADIRRAAPAERGVRARSGPHIGHTLDATLFARSTALTLEPASLPASVRLRGPVTATVDLASLTATPGEPGTVQELFVRSPDGSRVLQGFYETCNGIVAALCPADAAECTSIAPRPGTLPTQAETALVAELPSAAHAARCLGTPDLVEPVLRTTDVRVLGYDARGLVLAWRGRLLRVRPGTSAPEAIPATGRIGGPFAPGAAASPSGQYAAIATTEGIFVRDAQARWRIWSAPNLAGRYRQLTDVTISDDGGTVTAMFGGQLWVLDRVALPDAGTPVR